LEFADREVIRIFYPRSIEYRHGWFGRGELIRGRISAWRMMFIMEFVFENFNEKKSGGTLPPIEKAETREEWPLTFPERQMAAEQSLNPESTAYNINIAFEITGALDTERLEKSLCAVVARHDALRSYYPARGGEHIRKVEPQVDIRLERLRAKRDDTPGLIISRSLPFDLARAPLFRLDLYETGADEYVLNLNIHHIVMDGAGGEVFCSELWRVYRGETLPETRLDFSDYSVWCDEHPNRDGEKFFREMFADGLPENEMPTRTKRPDFLPFADVTAERRVDDAQMAERAHEWGVTRFSIVLSAVGLAIAKYCGSEDVVLGIPLRGRAPEEAREMIGMFVNTLPIRLKPERGMYAREYVRQVNSLVSDVRRRQTYPFEELAPILAPDRNSSRSPVFDVLLNYLPEIHIPEVEGLEIRRFDVRGQALAMDLVFEITYGSGGLRVLLYYSRELYMDEVAEGILDLFDEVLGRMIGRGREKSPDARTLLEISELPEAHRRRVLEAFAGRRSDKNRGRSVIDLFREQAGRSSGRRAVVFGGKELSYGELDDVTDRLAARLVQMGGGNVVGILVRRGEMMPVGAIGVLKSGSAYLPLDPSYPENRLAFMVKDGGVRVLIAERDLADRLPRFDGSILFTDEIYGLPSAGALSAPSPADAFILLYTSGTTGNPKGVTLSHSNLVNFCSWFCDSYGLTSEDNVPAYASFGFDACMMDMYPALTAGGCVHIIPEEMRLELSELNDYFNRNGVTVAFLTTQLGRQFVEMMDNRSLRALTVGGETLVPVAPPAPYALYNAYGPTECTIFVTTFRVDGLYDRVPIGRPIDNTSLYIVDRWNSLAPICAAGELCVAGRQVGGGYLNRPDLTAAKFTPNPFSDDPDYAVMYRTGDAARFLPDGNVDFVGRNDLQVKVRGFRVELSEIESRIRLYPGVSDATVAAVDSPGGGKSVVAYVVSDAPVDIEKLNRFIEQELPPYMVPSVTMRIEKIPLTPNGKVDRRGLPAPEIAADRSEETVPPATDLEREILALAAEICGCGEISVTANLLRAGLQSLSSIKLASQIKSKTGRSIGGADVMREKTVRRIAALLEERAVKPDEPDRAAAVGDAANKGRREWPLTENQMGVYYECADNPDSILYNIPIVLNLPAGVDAVRLRDAFLAAVGAHRYIRTRLANRNGELVQLEADGVAADVEIRSIDESALDDAKRAFIRPFDLFKGPLFRAEICRTGRGVYLFMDFHHIIFDGASCDIFVRDLALAYGGGEIERVERTSYESALEERALEGGEEWRRSAEYFKNVLSSFDGATTLHPDHPAALGTGTEASVSVAVPREGVSDFCRDRGLMPSSLFLGAAALAISRFTRTKDILLCAIFSGRDDARYRRSVGMRVKTLPVGIRVKSEAPVSEYLQSVQDSFFETIENQLYPLTRISADYGFKPDIMYAYQNVLASSVRLGGALAKIEPLLSHMPAKNPLTVTVTEKPDSFDLSLEYDEALYDELTVRALLESVSEGLRALMDSTAGKGSTLSGISVVSPEGLKRAACFNSPIRPSDAPNVFSLIETQAARTPDAQALIATDREMTYRELNDAANRLAHSLIDRGLGRGDRVILLLPRDSRVIVSMIGVIKAGGAYIPVDPTYPDERIRQIMEDSDARFVIAPKGDRGSCAGGAVKLTPEELMAHIDGDNPGVDVGPGDMIYLIYTSGSTGKPKGVMLRHGGVVNYISREPANFNASLIADAEARMVSVTTVSFDAFIDDIYIPLTNGLAMILASEEETRNPERLAELFERSGGSGLNITPSRLQQFMTSPRFARALSSCKFFDIGAEQFPSALYRDLRALNPDAVILNSYGPTESTVACNGKILKDADKITAGPPMWNVVESIRDAEGLPLPVGAPGELWIGGEGVAIGYANNPDLTRDRFVEEDGVRYYKSGDLARWTDDGEILIMGRIDEQVKLRGLRIELGEVENAILMADGVRNAAARVRKIRGIEHLCAWFTADRVISASELREELARTLPAYMLPTAILQMDRMPSTMSGKIDARSLPEPQLAGAADYAAPETEQEADFAGIFGRILNLDRVGALDSFFDIGGSSLLVARVIVEAHEKGYNVSYGDVFTNPTPRALAAVSSAEPLNGDAPGVNAEKPEKKSDRASVIEDYDYAPINRLLAGNSIASFRRGSRRPLGDIALTGATGFLGVHLLREFLASESGVVHCMVRSGTLDAEKRLKNLLVYYFSDSFDDLFGGRINVVEGDATDPESWDALFSNPVDTLFNCAANVKHFAPGDEIQRVNVGAAEQAVRLCLERQARLIHVSTTSIAGMSVDGAPPESSLLTEERLYFGQRLENQKYLKSKFLAERLILSAAEQGLDAKIMRVGNLMARQVDGEFQINFRTNSFVRLLRAYRRLGVISWEALCAPTELSPIDLTAEAILKLSRTPSDCRVFHPYDDHCLLMGDVINALNRRGLAIRPCETEEFNSALLKGLQDPAKSEDLGVMIAYSDDERQVMLQSANSYTSQALRRLGFSWPIVTRDYLDKFVEELISLGFFDVD
jgi:amino acid adenylation domain-containing protein/thioester reductase-like protein